MSTAITTLHIEHPPFTLRQVLGGWQAYCACGLLTPSYGLISQACQCMFTHGESHRLSNQRRTA